MSYTEIYKFTKSGNATMFAETRNAWRGAMAVWNIMDEKYLPRFIPNWAVRLGEDLTKRYHRTSDMGSSGGGAIKEIWDLYKSDKVSETDKIVLGSTFDNVIVYKKDIPKLVETFRKFEGETSLKEQADILEEAFKKDKNLIAVAWNQTSVNGDAWINDTEKDKDDNWKPYNIKKQNKHWDLFAPASE